MLKIFYFKIDLIFWTWHLIEKLWKRDEFCVGTRVLIILDEKSGSKGEFCRIGNGFFYKVYDGTRNEVSMTRFFQRVKMPD